MSLELESEIADFEPCLRGRNSDHGRRRPALFLSPAFERVKVSRDQQPAPALAVVEPTPAPVPEPAPLAAEVTTYSELVAGISARLCALGIRQADFDKLAGWADGMAGKAFGPSQTKRLGIEKVFDALRAASLKLVLVPDPEQLERMRKPIAENCQPRHANQARPGNRANISNKIVDEVINYLANKPGALTARVAAAIAPELKAVGLSNRAIEAIARSAVMAIPKSRRKRQIGDLSGQISGKMFGWPAQ